MIRIRSQPPASGSGSTTPAPLLHVPAILLWFGLALWSSYNTSIYYPPAIARIGIPTANTNGNQPQTGSNGGHSYPYERWRRNNTYPSGGNGGGARVQPPSLRRQLRERWIWRWPRADTRSGNGPADAAKEYRTVATNPNKATKKHIRHKRHKRESSAFAFVRFSEGFVLSAFGCDLARPTLR